jgi:hypothetical protein
MSYVQSPVSDMLITVKSREIQRGMLAEMRGDRKVASLHLLAAGRLELVLAADYDEAGVEPLALRSRMSAASCFWRGGDSRSARQVMEDILLAHPESADDVAETIAELEREFPDSNQNGLKS